ncbi:MAG: hypothetical protein HY296_07745 [Thaumarchaeota archaeon]|nr:hypothetical protein [Nitrososphaerota archaeon]
MPIHSNGVRSLGVKKPLRGSKSRERSTKGAFLSILAMLIALVPIIMGASPLVFASAPSANASCMGQEATGISPPGSSDEVPTGMPGFMSFIKTLSPAPGAVISFVASLQEGSHEACDEVLG